MTQETWIQELLPDAITHLVRCRECPHSVNTESGLNLPGKKAVCRVLDDFISVLFPGCHGHGPVSEANLTEDLKHQLRETAMALKGQIRCALEYQCTVDDCHDCDDCEKNAEAAVTALIQQIPEIQDRLQHDIRAAYEGDPAARSTMEVVMSYPGVYAVIVHRIAHVLYHEQIPLIPRIMSEHAHSVTGIDIHPGAHIGQGFFIDHGTGVVIGETAEIGDHVKLYQGVTLGALSFEKDEEGHLVKGIKRHPNVGDHVVIYAGATLLGGATEIGHHSVIGGNVWLTHSVPPGSKVYNQQPRPHIRQADGRWMVANGPWNDHGAGI
jgi:serine O-acetyltransferase